ncbi:MAG: hypothetical protein AAFX94_13385, partial [Myxococcota bacterium]
AVNLTPSATHPVNRGVACPKGWEALTPLAAPDRATVPLLRKDGRRYYQNTFKYPARGLRLLQEKYLAAAGSPATVSFLRETACLSFLEGGHDGLAA